MSVETSVKRFEATRQTIWTEIIRVMAIPGLATVSWFVWLWRYLPLSVDSPLTEDFGDVVFYGCILAFALLWLGIKVWEIANGELTIIVGDTWIRLPDWGQVESSEIDCVQRAANGDNQVYEFTLRNPSRFTRKPRTVTSSAYEQPHELRTILDELCALIHNDDASSVLHKSDSIN